MITIAVGVFFCIVTFGFLFWFSFLLLWFLPRWNWGHPMRAAGVVTLVFAAASLLAAWRRVDPMAGLEFDPNSKAGTGRDLALGMMIGIPIFRRQSLAGMASLFIGGPLNILDARSLWKSRIHMDEGQLQAARALLEGSCAGVPVEKANDPWSITVLARLGLIKAKEVGGVLMVLATAKGREAAEKA